MAVSVLHGPIMKFKAVIFDLDGTLLNTVEDIADAINEVLSKRGFATYDAESYRRTVGAGIEDLLSRLLPEGHRDEDTVAACIADARVEYAKLKYSKTMPYDGVVELLDELQKRGIKMAVLSNKPEESAIRQIAHYFPTHSFTRVEGAKPDKPLKPLPDVALEIMEDMNVKPSETIMVGDVEMDILVAINAGMYPVGVSWGFRTAEELRAAGAQAVIDHPMELIDILEDEVRSRK
jgi:phosphoglycolate phosphatase